MSCEVIRFTPDIMHSYPRLYNYLSGSKTDREVYGQVLEAGRYPDSNWMGTWKVIPLEVSAVFQVYFSVFACAMSYLCYAFQYFSQQLKRWSYQLDILSEIALHDPQPSGYWTFGSDFLAPSLNIYSLKAADLYLRPPLSKENIQDKKVRSAIHPKRTTLEFDKNDGFCLGESRWFLRYFFKTKNFFENHRDHMQALGKQFSWGAPPQAALLQKICPKEDELVGLVEDWDSTITIYGDRAPRDKTARCKRIAENFQNLQPGAYLLGVPKHAMAFICVEKGLGYLFDPNLGTVAIHDQAGYEKLGARILIYQTGEEKKEKDPRLCTIVEVYPYPDVEE